jgi:hypothetical protein
MCSPLSETASTSLQKHAATNNNTRWFSSRFQDSHSFNNNSNTTSAPSTADYDEMAEIDHMTADAEGMMDKKDWRGAVRLWEKIVSVQPRNVMAMWRYVISFFLLKFPVFSS